MQVEISNGELVDRVTILDVKSEKLENEEKRSHVQRERDIQFELLEKIGITKDSAAYIELKKLNEEIWDVIDEAKKIIDKVKIINSESWFTEVHLRHNKDRFIELSIKTIELNDRRYMVKKRIDEITNSNFKELKKDL